MSQRISAQRELVVYYDAWLDEALDDIHRISRPLGDIENIEGMAEVAKDSDLFRRLRIAPELRWKSEFCNYNEYYQSSRSLTS